MPKNNFVIKVNDMDIYCLIKEEVNFDPTVTETLSISLNFNDKKCKKNGSLLKYDISGSMPWIIDDFEDKVERALGDNQLICLTIDSLRCKSQVVNELLDLLTCCGIDE